MACTERLEAARALAGPRGLAARDADLGLLATAGVPDGVEFLQELTGNGRVVETGNALGPIGAQPIDDGAVRRRCSRPR